jgi:hypothetical protein
MMKIEEKQAAFKSATSGLTTAKREMMFVANRLDSIAPRKAEQLRKMIARLEDFQNSRL